jgi:glycopeptide antibiotics resistance protein
MFKKLLQTDKLVHNLLNYSILLTLAILVNYWVGLVVCIILSCLKEFVWDKWLKKGCFEIMDLISNTLGIIEATLIYLIYYL